MKEQRQKAILKLIQEEDLEVQEELLERLEEESPPEVQPLKARSIATAQARASVFFTFMIGPP